MAPRRRYTGRHRAPLTARTALVGAAALLAVLLGSAYAADRPAADAVVTGTSPTPAGVGGPDVTGPGDLGSRDAASRWHASPNGASPLPAGRVDAADGTAVVTRAVPDDPAAGRAAKPGAAPPSPESDRISSLEDQVAALVNRERERAGCRRLTADVRLRVAARRHSADMARHDYFSHTGRDGSTFVDRLAAAGYPRRHAAGENIAYGYSTPRDVVDAWMASRGHRSNILDCEARSTGVGLAYQGRRPYWTQEFGRG